MRIYYCDKCEIRLSEEDLESGQAVWGDNEHTYCVGCAPVPAPLASPVGGSANRAPARKTGATATRGSTPANGSQVRLEAVRTPNGKAKTASTPDERKRFPTKWAVLGGAVPLLALATAMYAMGIFSPTTRQTPAPIINNPPVTVVLGTTTPGSENALNVSGTKENGGADARSAEAGTPLKSGERTPAPRSVFDDMAREHKREFEPEQRAAHAAKKLRDATEFFAKTPQDPWMFAELLDRVPKSTPSADEAERLKKELKLPDDKSGTPGWFRDWTFTTHDAKATIIYDFDNRKNVLQTLPPGPNSEAVFSRSVSVPADKPFLTLTARTEDRGNCWLVAEVDGKQQLAEVLSGRGWRSFAIDLAPFKGKEVGVQLRDVTADSNSKIFWTQPVFHDRPQSGAKTVAFSVSADAFTRSKPNEGPKRAFVAPVSWSESPAWKTPIDLLGLIDPKADAVSGNWKRTDKGELLCEKNNAARAAIGYKLPEQYDVRATVERKTGNGDLALLLSHGDKGFIWIMGADNNRVMAISQVNGKHVEGNQAVTRCDNCVKNGVRYTMLVEVRKDRISAYVNGKLVQEWTPSMGDLSLHSSWKLPAGKTIGVGAFQSEALFSSLQLVEVK